MKLPTWVNKRLAQSIILIFGIIITLCSWFLNSSTHIPFVVNIVVPKHEMVKEVITLLESDSDAKAPISMEGSKILLDWWPQKPPPDLLRWVTHIGRIPSVIIASQRADEIGSFEMLLGVDNDMHLKGYRWPSHEVKSRLQQELETALFRWSSYTFFIGIAITLFSGLWGVYSRRDNKA